MPPAGSQTAAVQDLNGTTLSSCSEEKARELVRSRRAVLVSEDPLTIRLNRVIDLPVPPRPEDEPSLAGSRVLVHVCCGPCATYVVGRLRELQADVVGYWFNPNIHPYSEHVRRRDTLERYAQEIDLPMIWEAGYEMPAFLRSVARHEGRGERCTFCYRMRLDRAATTASRQGFDLVTTTLLISPYQDQRLIRSLGQELAQKVRIGFHFENFRRGFAEHHRLAREHDLYMQRYCGCIYSEWEALDREATTGERLEDAEQPRE